MDVFDPRRNLVDSYANYIRSFIQIRDERISAKVKDELNSGLLRPEPFNPPIPTRERCRNGAATRNPQNVRPGDFTSLASCAAWHVDSTPRRGTTNQPRASPGEPDRRQFRHLLRRDRDSFLRPPPSTLIHAPRPPATCSTLENQ